ncbi:FMN-binding negative transcriptional regulator [Mesorhizobium sp. M0136]|uniref:FMN-binding negative transcriptional regulator n=1 Tax=Mesorhizobium sp. M0136 TaxID=2956890 RepID=UPI00333B756E
MYVPPHFAVPDQNALFDLIEKHPFGILITHSNGSLDAVRDDERYVRRNVAKLTQMHEANQPAPWKMGDAPKDFIDTMAKAIVALEIEITSLVGKFKLSQNKELRDIQNAGETLTAQGAVEVGQAMLAAAAAKSQ